MNGWVAVLLLSAVPVVSSHASAPDEADRTINPLNLCCKLRDRNFVTEIGFSRNARNELVGEVANYVTSPDRGRQYLNGSELFDITAGEDFIEGNTGDVRGTVSRFKLHQVGLGREGIWVYEHYENSCATQRARFFCIYREP